MNIYHAFSAILLLFTIYNSIQTILKDSKTSGTLAIFGFILSIILAILGIFL